jgi:hypothetical protein
VYPWLQIIGELGKPKTTIAAESVKEPKVGVKFGKSKKSDYVSGASSA